VSEEATELVSLIPVIGSSNVGIIGDDEVVLSNLVLQVRDGRAEAALGDLGEGSGSQELLIILILEHRLELRSHCHAHLADFTLLMSMILWL
jgi:hypothetical protein